MEPNIDAAEFVRLWTKNTRQVFSYALSLVVHWPDAEGILQETGKVAWERFDFFEEGSNFFAWACAIATYKVLEHRRSCRRDKLVLARIFHPFLHSPLAQEP